MKEKHGADYRKHSILRFVVIRYDNESGVDHEIYISRSIIPSREWLLRGAPS